MSTSVAKHDPATRLSVLELRRRWRQMVCDPLVCAIPFKVELDEKGAIVVTPANTRHGTLQAFVARQLAERLPHGTSITECPVETQMGVRVPDVAWASHEFIGRHGHSGSFPRAPELCVEIVSPANSQIELREKTAAYLAAGAREVWLVAEDGAVEMFDASGRIDASSFGFLLAPPR